jgi:hypothetical protein
MATDMTWQVTFHSQRKDDGQWKDMFRHDDAAVATGYVAVMQNAFPHLDYRAIKRTVTEETL